MHHFTHCPIPASGGKDCGNNPHPGNSYGVCSPHWRKLADEWLGERPQVTVQCINCTKLSTIDSVELDYATCQFCHKQISEPGLIRELVERQRAAQIARPANKDLLGVVYYLRFSDRVKIGFTTDLDVRAQQIPHDEIVAAEPGTYALESQRHTEFSPERLTERGEWFNLTPRLAFHMANVRDKYGNPVEVSRARRAHGAGR